MHVPQLQSGKLYIYGSSFCFSLYFLRGYLEVRKGCLVKEAVDITAKITTWHLLRMLHHTYHKRCESINAIYLNTLRTGLLNCLNARSRDLIFRHHASCI